MGQLLRVLELFSEGARETSEKHYIVQLLLNGIDQFLLLSFFQISSLLIYAPSCLSSEKLWVEPAGSRNLTRSQCHGMPLTHSKRCFGGG